MSFFKNLLGEGRPAADPSLAELASRFAARSPKTGNPDVTVVIPVFNNWAVTHRCLVSLAACDPDVSLQVVVVDDASTDETPFQVARLANVDVVRNGTNLGFVHGCNRGAALARGQFVLFLNNDTEVVDDSLRALLRRARSDARIGVVGSKLVYPDGRLQEAGGILWSDASGWNYGRFDNPARPEYNFVRDVDYVSGAALLVPAALFRELGGFDEQFAPGYYEDADLCMAVRAKGYRVVYEPRSVVTHYEGVTSGTEPSSGMKRFQDVNRPKFRAKWRAELDRDHVAHEPSRVRAAARARAARKRTILVIDSYVPLHDREAGSNRLQHLVDGFLAAGDGVVFLPDNIAAMEPYTSGLQAKGVEVLYHSDGDPRRWKELLLDALPAVDIAWVCRPELFRKYLPVIRAHSDVPALYDTIDLHHVRVRRQVDLEGGDDAEWRRLEALELTCGRAADGTVVVSESEAVLLREAGIDPVAVVPTIHDVEPDAGRAFASTAGVIFIGGYGHLPNVDAVQWLVHEIMPLVWSHLPGVHVTLLGANAPPSVLALASERVTVTGYVADVSPYFQSARVFAASIRYGAGMKGKVGQALAHRLPTVTTPVGAEGFALTDGRDALIVERADEFAAAIVALYTNETLWTALASGAAEALGPFSRRRVAQSALAFMDRVQAQAAAPVPDWVLTRAARTNAEQC